MKKFYSNVGNKIKILAQVEGIIGIVSVIVGIIIALCDEESIGIALMISGVVISLSSLILYAFGQITEDIHTIKKSTDGTTQKIDNDLPEL